MKINYKILTLSILCLFLSSCFNYVEDSKGNVRIWGKYVIMCEDVEKEEKKEVPIVPNDPDNSDLDLSEEKDTDTKEEEETTNIPQLKPTYKAPSTEKSSTGGSSSSTNSSSSGGGSSSSAESSYSPDTSGTANSSSSGGADGSSSESETKIAPYESKIITDEA